MAGASQKNQAKSNTQTLKEIHTISAAINLATILILFVLHRPASRKPFVIFSIPLVIAQYIIEKTGRPKYLNGKLVSSGEDLKQSGLTEYLFDIVYFTLFCDLLMIAFGSNKVWYLYSIIPAFAAYKLFGLFQMGRQMFGGGAGAKKTQESGEKTKGEEQGKSKRQTKLEARNKKQQVRYR